MHAITYIVDDDQAVRGALSFMLMAAGRPARSFGGGVSLLAALPELAPGVLLIDVRMPGQDGLDLLDLLRARRVAWPAILMTGHGDLPLAARAIGSGAVDFLEKPFSEELLLSALSTAERLLRPVRA